MGLFSSSPIGELVNPVATLVTDLVDRIFPDKDKQAKEREEFLLQAQELDNTLAQGQLAINQAEASSESIFVAGWRPFIGWTCGVALAYHFIGIPLVSFIMLQAGRAVQLPAFDFSTLSTILMGMLGLGTMRTAEKVTNIIQKNK